MTRGTSVGDQVAHGRNGRLFLHRQDSYDLSAFLDGDMLPPAAHWRWRLTVERRARELAAIGIPYVFMIVPDSPSVYPEDLPDDLAAGASGRQMPIGGRMAETLRGIPNLTLVYPLREMLEAKGGLPLYRKTDTHWSGFGAYVGYRAFCTAVGTLVPVHPLLPREVRFALQPEFGDLGILLDPEAGGVNTAMRIETRRFERLLVQAGPDRTNSQRFGCAAAPDTSVLFMRDSFMTEQAPLMAVSFGKTEMVGTTSRLFMDHVLATRPDLVVTEICERRLGEWESDHQMAGFEDLFGTDWVSDLGRSLLAVELAVRREQVEAAARAALVLVERGGEWSPGHALTLGRALSLGQHTAAADHLLTQALAATPRRVSLLLAAAQAKFGLGDGMTALSLAYSAREMAPWNGFTHELLVYMLLAFERVAEARAVFDAAAPRITDNPALFLLGSQAAERDGDHEAAAMAMRHAARLWPDNPAFQERFAALSARLGQPAAALH